ncbi:MAG: ThuA domain-containing protein [Akkermansiaceae bacterium]|nr:ThuA domain-containing protein [Akkermansiaceae bacterium]
MRTKTKSSVIQISLFLVILVATGLKAEVEEHVASGDPSPATKKIFYFSQQNNSHHRPASFLASMRQDFGERGIQFTTSTNRNDLNVDNLNQYEGSFFFGNHNAFSPAQTSALESYIQSGGGMVGMHVIAYVARSNETLARILGGAFRGHHSIAQFTAKLIQAPGELPDNLAIHPNFPFEGNETYSLDLNHPILQGLSPYSSFDEPYLHQNLNPDITLLSFREDHGGWDEPYTWVRNEGNGRVFYHANGHDARTWFQPNFRELMVRGTLWASKKPRQNYLELFPPTISASGDMQHLALVQTNDGAQFALYSGGHQTAMSGLQVPGDNEDLSYLISSDTIHAILSNQRVALTPKVLLEGKELSCLLIGHPQYPTIAAIENGSADPIEAGFTFSPDQTFSFITDSNQAVIFSASIEDSAGGNQKRAIAIHDSESVIPMLIEGDLLNPNDTSIVSSIPDSSVFLYSDNKLAIMAQIQSDQGGPKDVILTGHPGNFHPHISAFQTYNGLPQDSMISEFLAPISLKNDDLTFSGRLEGASIDQTNDQFVARISKDGELDLIIRENDPIEGHNLLLTLDLLPPISQDRDTLVLGSLGDDLVIISARAGRSPIVLARENQKLATNEQDYLITQLHTESIMSEGNQLVMLATLRATDSENEISALLQIGSGTIRPLIVEGHAIDLSEGSHLVSEIHCHPSGPQGSGLKNNELRVKVSFSEGGSSIIGIPNIDDLDQDGWSDTLESAFGNSTLELNASIPPGYPKVTHDVTGQASLTFWEPITAGPGLEYRIEMSVDMKNWITITPEIVPASDQTDLPKNYRKMIALIADGNGPRFYRLAF